MLSEDSILGADKLIARARTSADCPIDTLFFVDLANPASNPLPIDPPYTCEASSMVEDTFGDLKVFWHEKQQELYISRDGIPGVKIWSLQTGRAEPASGWPTGDKTRLLAIDSGFKLAAVFDED